MNYSYSFKFFKTTITTITAIVPVLKQNFCMIYFMYVVFFLNEAYKFFLTGSVNAQEHLGLKLTPLERVQIWLKADYDMIHIALSLIMLV